MDAHSPTYTPTITVLVKHVYGKQSIYPVDTHAETFCRLLGQTTLTMANLKHILALGYQINYQHPQLEMA